MTEVNGVDMSHCVTVRELIDALERMDHTAYVIMASDSEGNSFSPLSSISTGLYRPEKTWWGEAVNQEDIDNGDDDAEGTIEVVYLDPVN